MKKLKVAIAGVTGYTGQALLKILLKHPLVEISNLYSSRYNKKELSDLEKAFLSYQSQLPKLETLEVKNLNLKELDCLFLATPNGFASQVIRELALFSDFFSEESKTKIIDLAADFRLKDQTTFQEYYDFSIEERFSNESIYGLSEFVNRENLKQKKIIANPGCYPTCSLLALLPLIREDLINTQAVCIIDAKSGITGAGKKALESLIFAQVSESFKAYNVEKHRHKPEIIEKVQEFTQQKLKVRFVPHLLPIRQGMLSNIYLQLKDPQNAKNKIKDAYQKYYQNSPFVRVVSSPPETSDVLNTNNCLIYPNFDQDTKILNIISVIDNLIKGAAGQAVQNFNLSFGIEEETGLV